MSVGELRASIADVPDDYEVVLDNAEAEKEALRAESSIARMDAERYAGDVEALDALTTLITDVYTSHPLDIARVILASDFMAQVKRDAYDAGFHDGRAER